MLASIFRGVLRVFGAQDKNKFGDPMKNDLNNKYKIKNNQVKNYTFLNLLLKLFFEREPKKYWTPASFREGPGLKF